ncbi:solute carrier organic anion transporter family, member 1D1 [Scleropages formosus]|uniref:Solute carrier organic anion transporter family member n=1 Tax=Scleropages formosus TaxID=113540 RepID=A0A8C9UY40_SCLFO|nr:solute carrier organic anion transporter family member 1C1-like [Scleropages formosus]
MGKDTKEAREPCCSRLKMFLVSLSFVYFAKAFQGSYMKSSVIQIERRFDVPSSLIGVIDGSFEIGNLLIIAFVSYFGAKLHRPKLIAVGCLVMASGSFLTALPHFFQERYQYETTISQSSSFNSSQSVFPCVANQSKAQDWTSESKAACENEASSYMWIYVFLGNMIRGIGETPVMPLGISYLDDFAREENTAFYIACIQTVGIMGPVFGFLLGSFCAKLYVDIGAVDLETVSIDHKDSRWVGAWWLGFLVTGVVMLLAGIPFWFLPRSLPKQGEDGKGKKDKGNDSTGAEQDRFIVEKSEAHLEKPRPVVFSEMAKGFLPSLKRLFSNTVFLLIILVSLVQVNGFVGMTTFKPKYMEQVYGQSPSKAIFFIGIMTLPAVALGIITGGFVMKRFKLGVLGAARLSISVSILFFLCLIIQYFLQCENAQVAGLTVSYQGVKQFSYQQESLLSQCNLGCSCSLKHWDPVCAYNGITYASPCLAGCQSSTGSGKEMVFHNCTCVNAEWPLPVVNSSAALGQCSRHADCNHIFKYYMAMNVLSSFMIACGATPGFIVLLRSIQPDLKSLALGMQILIIRTLGGIPGPIYFGALIDRTCLKWGSKKCGGRGACRLYDSDAFRVTFLGLLYGLYSLSYLLWGFLYSRLSRRQKELALQNQVKASELEFIGVHKHNKEMDLPLQSKEEQERDNSV